MDGVIRRIRLASGLVMFAYVTTHFVNHSLGLVSVQLMDRAVHEIHQYWASTLGGVLLYGAFATHYGLALWALWLRRSLKMPFAEAAQLVLGFSIPFLLADHVLLTRVADTFYEFAVGYYTPVLYAFFVANPQRGAVQLATVLVLVWIHGCIGLHFWLRLKSWYPRQPFRSVCRRAAACRCWRCWASPPAAARSRGWPKIGLARRRHRRHRLSRRSGRAAALRHQELVPRHVYRLPVAVLVARLVRQRIISRRAVVISYLSDGQRGRSADPGTTILEASRIAGIPHASVCGGRGRCSTCRVRVSAGDAESRRRRPTPKRKVLDRVGAAPNVRLACQARPTGAGRHRAAAARHRQAAGRPGAARLSARATRRRSRSCSPICAPSPAWPSTSCPTTWCSCSTAISAPWGGGGEHRRAPRQVHRRRRDGAVRHRRQSRRGLPPGARGGAGDGGESGGDQPGPRSTI